MRNQQEELLDEMRKLISAKVNDGVKLAYLSEEQLELIDGLDLTALTEFKRSNNGVVEVKFNDRLKVMEQILTLMQEGEESKVNAMLSALGGEG